MRTLLTIGLLFIATVTFGQVKIYTVYADTVVDIADIDSAIIEIAFEPDTIAVHDTLYVGGDSALVSRIDHIIDQIPRMEVADSNTWVNLATLVNLVSQVKALVETNGVAVRAPLMTDAAFVAFLNQTPRPKIVSAQRISAQWWVYYRP